MDRRLQLVALDYLKGELPLERLNDIVMSYTWDGVVPTDADTLDVANLIDLRVAEFTGGHITEDELRRFIADAVGPNQTYVLSAGEFGALARGTQGRWGMSAQTQRRKVAFG